MLAKKVVEAGWRGWAKIGSLLDVVEVVEALGC